MPAYRPWRPTFAERFAPVWLGAMCLASITALRAAFFFLVALLSGNWTGVDRAVLAVVVAAVGGAAGGLAYVAVGAPLRAIPLAGRFLAGIVTVAAYLAAILSLIQYIDPAERFSLREPAARFSFIVCSLIFGLAVGQFWFADQPRQAAD